MSVIEILRMGHFGIELVLPPQLVVHQDDQLAAMLVDPSTETLWYFFLFPDFHADLSEAHRARLRTSLEWYARAMFEAMFEAIFQPIDRVDRQGAPRTADPSWSPMVDVAYLTVGGAEALQTIHRMAYQPGRETVMGHLLVPLRQGLFEARISCIDRMTGYRESMLVDQRLRANPPTTADDLSRFAATIKQADFDDPRHDAAFPDHALSRSRAALRWLCTESGLRVSELAAPIGRGEVPLPHLGCAIVPPLGFVYQPPADSSLDSLFRRMAFCGTDGVELLLVQRLDLYAVGSDFNLARWSETRAREMHADSGVQDLKVTVEGLPPLHRQARVVVIVEGRGHAGPLRNAMLFFRDDHGQTWSLGRYGTSAVPPEDLVADLDAVSRTFHQTDIPASRQS